MRYPADSPHRAWLQVGRGSNLSFALISTFRVAWPSLTRAFLMNFSLAKTRPLFLGEKMVHVKRRAWFSTECLFLRSGRAGGSNQGLTAGEEGLRDLVVSQLSRMMVAAVVVRLADLTLWKVSTATPNPGRGQSTVPSELVRGDMARLHLPPDLPLVHLELSTFYYPSQQDFPLPPPCLLLTANPITVWLDILTLVWLNAFTVNLQKSVAELQRSLQLDEGDASYANVKVTLLL